MNFSPFVFELLIKQRLENTLLGNKILVLENYEIDNPRLCKEILKRFGIRIETDFSLNLTHLLKILGFVDVVYLTDFNKLGLSNLLRILNIDQMKYDVILDNGSLQNIFNIPNALENIDKLLESGGSIIHITPVNNYVDFGIYQISPKLFFNFYKNINYTFPIFYLIEHHQEIDVIPWKFIEYSPALGQKISFGGLGHNMYLSALIAKKPVKIFKNE